MRLSRTVVCLVALLGFVPSASAGPINGGFQSGDFTGWLTTGEASITSGPGMDPRTNGNLALVGVDPFSAMVGNPVAPLIDQWYGGSSISQSWTVLAGDDTDLYFAWAAVGLVPLPPPDGVAHTTSQTPWFQIQVMKGATTLFEQQYYTGNIGSITPGWLQGASQPGDGVYTYDGGTWFYRPWDTFHLNLAAAGVLVGDTLSVTLSTRDCTLGGHASYAYLDGFGSTPPDLVPDFASTLLLFGTALTGLGAIRHRLR
jgi:hypothetical protein